MTDSKAQFSVERNGDNGIVIVRASGRFTKADGERMITAARQAATTSGRQLLYDVREVTTDIPLEEWFLLPRELPALKSANARATRVALLVTAVSQESPYQFYELVTANIGLSVRVLLDEDEALQWLSADD